MEDFNLVEDLPVGGSHNSNPRLVPADSGPLMSGYYQAPCQRHKELMPLRHNNLRPSRPGPVLSCPGLD